MSSSRAASRCGVDSINVPSMLTRQRVASRQARSSGRPWRLSWRRSAGMVKQQPIRRAIHLEFAFDRLPAAKLEQAYDILVSDPHLAVGCATGAGAAEQALSD